MKIALCGSMAFHNEMGRVKASLESHGHVVFVPDELDNLSMNESYLKTDEEKITKKIEHDFIRAHFRKIEQVDAILILNYKKKNIEGYIGGNTFLEMGLAFWLDKKVFLLHAVPEMDYKTEMHAMQPIVLNGDLNLLQ